MAKEEFTLKLVNSFKTIFKEFAQRKNTAILMIESSFFKKRQLDELVSGELGQVLKKYKKVIIIIPYDVLIDLEAEQKRRNSVKAKKILRQIIDLMYEGKMQKGLLGTHLQISKGVVTFLFPNKIDEYFLPHKFGYQVKDTPSEKEIRIMSLALKFARFNDTYISGFNPIIWAFCRTSLNVQHLNPIKLNKERISNEYFFS